MRSEPDFRSSPRSHQPAARPRSAGEEEDPEGAERHGAHTLRRMRGTVVGLDRDDVFVDLGPRCQGLISAARFAEPPALGDEYDFHLLGQEEGLWRLALAGTEPSVAWERMRAGLLVEARVTGVNAGGFDLKVGALHAFMPRSHSGLGRRERPRTLLGRTFAAEVLEVDRERQRVILSRKLVMRRERAGGRARDRVGLRPGQVFEGRVTRLVPFGAFVRFGAGFEGLVHVSDIAHERVRDPADVLEVGALVPVKVLTVRADGRRIGLGIKQLDESPWAALSRAAAAGDVVAGEVVAVRPEGVLVRLDGGAEAFAPRSALGAGEGTHPAGVFHVGLRLAWRIAELDVERERAVLSLLHPDGARVRPEELEVGDDPCIEWASDADLPRPRLRTGPSERDGRPGHAARLARALVREVRDLHADLDADGSAAARAS